MIKKLKHKLKWFTNPREVIVRVKYGKKHFKMKGTEYAENKR